MFFIIIYRHKTKYMVYLPYEENNTDNNAVSCYRYGDT